MRPEADRKVFGIPDGFGGFPLLRVDTKSGLAFKGWRGYCGDKTVMDLELVTGFLFPKEYVNQCRKFNGGVLKGILLFNCTQCIGLCVNEILGFGDCEGDLLPEYTIVGAIRAYESFKSGALSHYVPFARVSGSISPEEKANVWNRVDSFLAFYKSDASVWIVSPEDGMACHVADSYEYFLIVSVVLWTG